MEQINYNDTDIIASDKIGIVAEYSSIKLFIQDKDLRPAVDIEIMSRLNLPDDEVDSILD